MLPDFKIADSAAEMCADSNAVVMPGGALLLGVDGRAANGTEDGFGQIIIELVAVTEGYGMAEAKHAIEELFHKGIDFSAVFAISDSQAIAAMKVLSEHGISVPENCSVVGVDGIEVSEYTIPTLTTLAQPKRELGESSVRILLDIIEGLSEQSHLLLETELREGGSVRNIK